MDVQAILQKSRPQIEAFAGLLAEKRRRLMKLRHQRRGYRDENGEWQGGLLAFVRDFWHVLEPGTKFVEGWPLEAICEHLEAVTFGEITNLLINVPPGFMKPVDVNEMVLTTKGWKKHGDLAIGDYVFGADGLPKKVISRTPNHEKPCRQIEFDDGSEVVAADEHLWLVERERQRETTGCKRWFEWEERIVRTDEIQIDVGPKSRKRSDRIALTPPLQFETASLPIDPYLLGAWLGDGASDQGVIYSGQQDLAHFRSLGKELKTYKGVARISVEGLTRRLRELGILGDRSGIAAGVRMRKRIPEIYQMASVQQRIELLQGLMDTDGQADKGGWCRFTTIKKELAEDFVTLACSLGLKPHLSQDTSCWRVRFTPPPGFVSFKLARKQERLSVRPVNRIGHRYVRAVKDVGSRLVNCIQVEGGLYLVSRRFIVTHNSMLVDVMWPAWEWGPMQMPHVRYVAFSYSASLTERDNGKFRDLITCADYQAMYGAHVKPRKIGETKVTNSKHGWKLATSVGGVGTGERGDRIILDDPHNVKESESAKVREETVRWFRESMSSRLNDMEHGAKIIIMQRVNEGDVSGTILDLGFDYVHLMIPMEYVWDADENGDPYATEVVGWIDPRWTEKPEDCNGVLAWEERFPAKIIPKMKKEAGPHAWAGQYQQSPEPRGGGIFKRHYWQDWEPIDGKFPQFDYIVASLDSAFTENEENDPSALTVWGTFRDGGFTRAMLIHGWQKWLEFQGEDQGDMKPRETMPMYLARVQPNWGLVEWINYTCTRFRVDRLLIEAKASGISTAQTLRKRFRHRKWAVQLTPVKGDKVARALAVQPAFSEGLIYVPTNPLRSWADLVISQMAVFPKGKHDDLTDSATQAIKHLRDMGLLQSDEDVRADEVEAARIPEKRKSLYGITRPV